MSVFKHFQKGGQQSNAIGASVAAFVMRGVVAFVGKKFMVAHTHTEGIDRSLLKELIKLHPNNSEFKVVSATYSEIRGNRVWLLC